MALTLLATTTIRAKEYRTGYRYKNATQQQRHGCHRFASDTILQHDQQYTGRQYGRGAQCEHDKWRYTETLNIPRHRVVTQSDDHTVTKTKTNIYMLKVN